MCDLTKEDLQIIISRAVNSSARVVGHKVEPFSRTKYGVMGIHFLLTIDFENDSKLSTLTFFLKKPVEESISGEVSVKKAVFESEVQFFKELQPFMLRHYNGPKWSPDCYLAETGSLVFEDLRAKDYLMPPCSGMYLKTIESCIDSLARFHVSSILLETSLGKSLLEVYPDLLKEKLFNKNGLCWKFCEIGYKTIALMAKNLGLDPVNVPKIFDYVYEIVQPKKGFVNVVCHGDLWNNNFLIGGTKNSHCIIVDFQEIKYSSFASDLTMLLYFNTTPEFRKKSEVDMLKSYYAVFQDALTKSDINVDIPSYESMCEEYEKYKLYGMSMASIYLPCMCLNSKGETSSDVFEGWMFSNRFELIKPFLNSDYCYANKMRGIFRELIEYADQIFR